MTTGALFPNTCAGEYQIYMWTVGLKNCTGVIVNLSYNSKIATSVLYDEHLNNERQ